MMIKKAINTAKSGRFFLSQQPHKKITQVWVVCHGYGQLANYFLKWFEPVFNDSTLIIAPEGLHRFYLSGFSGKVGASWMTKEDRETDIIDYITFMDNVINSIKGEINKDYHLHALGFSQGVATITRWICNTNHQIDSISLWAGEMPKDLNYKSCKSKLNALNPKLFIGENDQFYSKLAVKKELSFLKENQLSYSYIEFDGKHKIEPEPLQILAKSILSS